MKLNVTKKYGIMMIVICYLLFGSTLAQAMSLKIDFTADYSTGPYSAITGKIIYEADSATSAIRSLDSIDIIIGDHQYCLTDVGFYSPLGTNSSLIGGTINGVLSISSGTNDFWLVFNHMGASTSPENFYYTTKLLNNIYSTTSFSTFRISAVPEPAAIYLFGLGLVVLAGVGKKIRN